MRLPADDAAIANRPHVRYQGWVVGWKTASSTRAQATVAGAAAFAPSSRHAISPPATITPSPRVTDSAPASSTPSNQWMPAPATVVTLR